MGTIRYKMGPSRIEKEANERACAKLNGLEYDKWLLLDKAIRESMVAEMTLADEKRAKRIAAAQKRERHYAEMSGVNVERWRGMDKEARKLLRAKIDEIDRTERALREQEKRGAKERAAISKLRSDAKKVSHKKPAKDFASGLPGATRYSLITGLMASPTDRKWRQFLIDGPYWNYLVNYIRRRDVFKGRDDRVKEAVQNTCAKIGQFMATKRYQYPEEGKGYFRGFLKLVAFNTALSLLRQIRRQELKVTDEEEEGGKPHAISDDMIKAHANCKRRCADSDDDEGLEAEIGPSSESDLDAYDALAGFDRNVDTEEGGRGKWMALTRLEWNPFSDDETPSNYDPASMFDYLTKISKEDLKWVRKLQVHVLYIALGYVLTDEKVSVDKREMLRLRYGCGMKVKDIFAMPRFAGRKRSALDVQMKRAVDDFREEIKTWWDVVAPDKNDFADETVMKFWRELSRSSKRAKMANDLQDKAIATVGRIE